MQGKTIQHAGRTYQSSYEEFTIDGHRCYRPLSISGPLAPANMQEKNVSPLSLLTIDGNKNGLSRLRPLNTERGHLIASSLGGPDVPENIIPMYAYVNGSSWASIEHKAREMRDRFPDALVTVTLDYSQSSDPRIPGKLEYTLVPPKPHQPKIYPCPHNKPVAAYAGSFDLSELELVEDLEEILDTYSKNYNAWSFEKESLAGGLILPGPSVVRPYEMLDYLKARHGDFPNLRFQNGAEFTNLQKDWILKVNQLRNYGEIISDADDDTKEPLIGGRGNLGAVIDHIEPRIVNGRPHGSNAFSNARVVSAEYNLYKSNRSPQANISKDIYSTDYPAGEEDELLVAKNGNIASPMQHKTERDYR